MHEARMNGDVRGEALSRMSTGLVQLYARNCGKGPTQAKTYIREDLVVCVFRDPFTKPERTLIDCGDVETVERMRSVFHETMEAESRLIIEEGCGRRVVACLAATHVDPEISIEIFVLEPTHEDPSLLDVAGSGSGNGLPPHDGPQR